MLTEEERKDLVAYRIEKAWRVLEEAKDNARLGHWNLTGNRLYYSVFHIHWKNRQIIRTANLQTLRAATVW